MAATRTFMNVFACNWTPTGGTAVPITGVTALSISCKDHIEDFYGDFDRFSSSQSVTQSVQDIQAHYADLEAATKIVAGPGVLTFTIGGNAKNFPASGVGSGALTGTFAALAHSLDYSGDHSKFGMCTQNFHGSTSDGATPPLAWSAPA